MSIKAVWGTTMDQKVHKGKQDLLEDMGGKKKFDKESTLQ